MKTKDNKTMKNLKKVGSLKATLESSGKLKLSPVLYDNLPKHLMFSFDVKTRILYITAGNENDSNSYKKRKTIIVYGLSFEIVKENISLPIHFEFRYSSEEEQWIGKIAVSKKKKDFQNQIIIHKNLIKNLVYTKAHSIPFEEREQIAHEKLFEAINSYNDSYGDFDEFASWLISKELKEENKKYSTARKDFSLDGPIKNGKGDSWCLYDVVGDKTDVASDAVENITVENLKVNLEEKKETLQRMAIQGYTLPEISEALHISEEGVYNLAKIIGEDRNKIK